MKICKQLAEAKAKYAIAMRENADLLKSFVVQSPPKEVKKNFTEDSKKAWRTNSKCLKISL